MGLFIFMLFDSAYTEDTSSCLLINFDNAAKTQDGAETSKVLNHRIVRASFSAIRSLPADLVVVRGRSCSSPVLFFLDTY